DGIEEAIKSSNKKYLIKDEIQFELAIVKTITGKGEVKIVLADIGGKYTKEKVSKVKFSICTPLEYRKDFLLELRKTKKE
ncbi:MAG: hypothetical protein KKG04_01915, partial [Candidatus Thermoplasmatota archaeon]|nr:hypothetical protein [Candidatus Thermoplasmatota archaeon]